MLALIVAVAVPLVVTTPSRQFLYANVLLFALIALSLVVLTGWAGQVSLGQAAFAGIGALGFAALVNGNPLGLGYGTHRVVIDLPKFPPVVALIVMTAVCALDRGGDRRRRAARPRPAPRHRDVHVRARRAAVHLPGALPLRRRRRWRVGVRANGR